MRNLLFLTAIFGIVFALQSEKKILLGLSVRMKNAMEEAATAEGVSDVTKWLRRLILERLFRYHRHDLDDFR